MIGGLLIWLLKSCPFELNLGFVQINLVCRLLEELFSELSRKEDPRYKLRPERVQQVHALLLCGRRVHGRKNENCESKPTPHRDDGQLIGARARECGTPE